MLHLIISKAPSFVLAGFGFQSKSLLLRFMFQMSLESTHALFLSFAFFVLSIIWVHSDTGATFCHTLLLHLAKNIPYAHSHPDDGILTAMLIMTSLGTQMPTPTTTIQLHLLLSWRSQGFSEPAQVIPALPIPFYFFPHST